MICCGIRRRGITLLFVCVVSAVSAHVVAQEPAAGERREIKFIGEQGEECIIAFRWCPSAVMKDGDPDDASGRPNANVEGFWLSETEVSQQEYRIIAGDEAMEKAKAYILDNVARPVPEKPESELTENDRRALEERELARQQHFGDDGLPVWGTPPADADGFCVKLSSAYDRFRRASGRQTEFSTLMFRMPSHFEWQYACRAASGRKHFVRWPNDPKSQRVGEFENYADYLQKKDPELFQKHKDELASFDGTEESMVRLLGDAKLDKAVRRYLEELLRSLLASENEVQRVVDAPPNSWNIKGIDGNVAEWVLLVESASPDRDNMPSPGDFSAGNGSARAACAGSWNSASGKNVPWPNLSIWHWQKEKAYGWKQQDKARGQSIGMRILMTDAVAETWFADLRQMAEQAYEGKVTANALRDGFQSGLEVVSRDKEGRTIASFRIGIYGALAESRSGDEAKAAQSLQDAVNGLKESGDEFFAQLEPLLSGDDLRN